MTDPYDPFNPYDADGNLRQLPERRVITDDFLKGPRGGLKVSNIDYGKPGGGIGLNKHTYAGTRHKTINPPPYQRVENAWTRNEWSSYNPNGIIANLTQTNQLPANPFGLNKGVGQLYAGNYPVPCDQYREPWEGRCVKYNPYDKEPIYDDETFMTKWIQYYLDHNDFLEQIKKRLISLHHVPRGVSLKQVRCGLFSMLQSYQDEWVDPSNYNVTHNTFYLKVAEQINRCKDQHKGKHTKCRKNQKVNPVTGRCIAKKGYLAEHLLQILADEMPARVPGIHSSAGLTILPNSPSLLSVLPPGISSVRQRAGVETISNSGTYNAGTYTPTHNILVEWYDKLGHKQSSTVNAGSTFVMGSVFTATVLNTPVVNTSGGTQTLTNSGQYNAGTYLPAYNVLLEWYENGQKRSQTFNAGATFRSTYPFTATILNTPVRQQHAVTTPSGVRLGRVLP